MSFLSPALQTCRDPCIPTVWNIRSPDVIIRLVHSAKPLTRWIETVDVVVGEIGMLPVSVGQMGGLRSNELRKSLDLEE